MDGEGAGLKGQHTGTVAKGFRGDIEGGEQAQEEIGSGGSGFGNDAAAARDAAGMAGEEEREVMNGVAVAFGESAAVEDGRVIEEGAIAVAGGLEAGDEVGEELGMVAVDLGHFFDEIGMTAVVSEGVVGVGDADFRIDADAAFAAHHHGGNAGEVGLEGDDLKVEHEADIVAEEEGDAARFFSGRDGNRILLGFADTLFDFADRGEIFVELALIEGAQLAGDGLGGVAGEVEDAIAIESAAGAGGGIEAGIDRAEEAFKDGAGIDLDGHGGVGFFPGQGVGVGATGAGVAITDHAGILAAQLKGSDTGLAGEVFGGYLIESSAGVDVGAGGVFGDGAGQETAAGLGVSAALGLFAGEVGETGDEGNVLAEGSERGEDALEFEAGAVGGPILHDDAVGDINDGDAAGLRLGAAAGEGGLHGIEEREADGDTGAAEKLAAGEGLTG